MNKVLTMIIALLIPVLSFGQQIDGFNSVPDTSYWDYEVSASADSTLSFINASYVTDPLSEGSHTLQLDYSAHNIEGWGGYVKIYHMHPELANGGTYDWSGYDSLSLSYYVSSAQSGTNNVELRLNLRDYSGAPVDTYTGLGEYFIHFIMS